MTYRALEKAITRWATAEPNVQALVLIGSQARKDHPADTWSDLDLMLLVTNQNAYVDDSSWFDTFGEVWLRVLNFTGAGDPEWMILYAGGLKVDFILVSATGSLSDTLNDFIYAKAVQRGVRILLDKKGDIVLVSNPTNVNQVWVRPSPVEFAALLHQFWLSIYRASNMLQRGELWRARTITDGHVRQQLLRMLEWHARAKKGRAVDTWYQGRFLTDWVEPHWLAQLPQIFALYSSDATRHAIIASMTLMDNLGRETADIWHYPYPLKNQTQIQEWIKVSLSGV